MNSKQKWTVDLMKKLHDLKTVKQFIFRDISRELGISELACRARFLRTDWDLFYKNPEGYMKPNHQKWTIEEMAQLHILMQTEYTYKEIAKILNRNPISVERQADVTNWEEWQKEHQVRSEAFRNNTPVPLDENVIEADKLVSALIDLSRQDLERLKTINEKEFLSKVNIERDNLPVSYEEIKLKTEERMESWGLKNPSEKTFEKGTYVIVGDSHGKHTKRGMFRLLHQVNSFLRPQRIIHVGHLLDDDADVSFLWEAFNNLTLLTKSEELKTIHPKPFRYDIVRDAISLGRLTVMNQDMITDFNRQFIGKLDTNIFEDSVVVNSHRQEMDSKCVHGCSLFVASPGCLCEPHIVKTIKQIDFKNGYTIRESYPDGYIKYRKMKHYYKYWTQGLTVVNVDANGDFAIVQCPIQKIGDRYVTCYFDKMITESGVENPDKKIFVTADAHCCNHDNEVLDVQECIVKDYKPDTLVNLGDVLNNSALNHHQIDRNIVIFDDVLKESAETNYVMHKMSKWAKEKFVICGNHERFAKDFVDKFPQLSKLLSFPFMCSLESLGYDVVPLKEVLTIGTAKFIHGDLIMYGQTGSKLEKAARTFKKNVFVGHVHYPSMRFGSCTVGLSGRFDQFYNEPSASNWAHGFGLCNQYKGESWSTTIAIIGNKCLINNKSYVPIAPSKWKMQKYTAFLNYDFS